MTGAMFSLIRPIVPGTLLKVPQSSGSSLLVPPLVYEYLKNLSLTSGFEVG
jgi:hypothetical protein